MNWDFVARCAVVGLTAASQPTENGKRETENDEVSHGAHGARRFGSSFSSEYFVHTVHVVHNVHTLCPSGHWLLAGIGWEYGHYGHYGHYGQSTSSWIWY